VLTHKLPLKHELAKHIADVLISSPADGQVLTYEAASAKWKNKAAGGLPSGSIMETLVHDSINWVNRILSHLWYANIEVGAGSVVLKGSRADITTLANIPGIAYVYCGMTAFPLTIASEPMFMVDFGFSALIDFICCHGLGVSSDPYSTSTGSIGLEIDDGALYSYSSDGTTRSRLDLSTTLGAGYHRLIQRLTSGVGLETWWDGVKKATKTTNLPSTQNISTWCAYMRNRDTATSKTLYTVFPHFAWKA